jgi:diaminohydroxyphosphoribosylaminopyrimidine deaminase/5-amino-6-(5-phosphoribosylamino)uracil reductase
VAALDACSNPGGATCVVTLEPCAHHGKTPPCTDALVAAAIGRVVVAVGDPSPDSGRGVERLRQAGVEVEVGLLEREAAALNAAFLWAATRAERPFVALKLAVSVDGFIADETGRSRWISGPEAREFVQWLRAGFAAVGVGRETAVRDDPRLTVRGPVAPRLPPSRVIFARGGNIPAELKALNTPDEAPTIVITRSEHVPALERRLNRPVPVLGAAGVADALRRLRERDLRSLLVEGGGRLAAALLAADVVDRIYWIQAPLFLGSGVRAIGGRRGLPLESAPRWIVTDRRALGDDTLLVVDRRLCLQGS